jgi:hypothetical protein
MSTKRDWHIRNVTWPPRPPALTALKPSDFFFWNYIKISVYIPPWPTTLPELARWIPATAATDHRPCDDSRRGVGVSGAARGTTLLLLVGATGCSTTGQTENIKHFEQHFVNECVRTRSSSNSFTTKYCACAPIAFLAGTTSLSVDSSSIRDAYMCLY